MQKQNAFQITQEQQGGHLQCVQFPTQDSASHTICHVVPKTSLTLKSGFLAAEERGTEKKNQFLKLHSTPVSHGKKLTLKFLYIEKGP